MLKERLPLHKEQEGLRTQFAPKHTFGAEQVVRQALSGRNNMGNAYKHKFFDAEKLPRYCFAVAIAVNVNVSSCLTVCVYMP